MRTPFYHSRGIGLIEIVIGVGIFVVIVVSLLGAYRFFVRFSGTTAQTTKAYFLLEEGLEVARVLRDANWETLSTLPVGTPHYLVFSGNIWTPTSTPVVIDSTFYRTITLASVYRDGDEDIAETGTLDPETYLVTATVSWSRGGATTTRTLSTYITNLFQVVE